MIAQLDTENADRNITSIITVLTDTPDASNNVLCQGLIMLGDGTKNLDGSGGNFEFTVSVDGQIVQPNPQVVNFDTSVRAAVWTTPFPVPANTVVLLRVKSPNAADSDVDITAFLYEVAKGFELAAVVPANTSSTPNTVGDLLYFVRQIAKNILTYTKSTDVMVLRNDADNADLLSHSMTDDATKAERGAG